MDYIKILQTDLENGYSKSDLEKLIGLPKNNLSGILKGDRKLSKKSELKIEKWDKSEKPDPLTLHDLVYANGGLEGQVVNPKFIDLAKGVIKNTPNKTETTKEPLDKDAEIAKIEELLKMPEKYVDALKRAKLENRLYELRYNQQ